jgi:hypothetical protein
MSKLWKLSSNEFKGRVLSIDNPLSRRLFLKYIYPNWDSFLSMSLKGEF